MIRTRLLEWRPTTTFWAAIIVSITLAGVQAARHISPDLISPARSVVRLESGLMDLFYRGRYRVAPPVEHDDRFALITIDARASKAMGRYPSRKHFLAALLNRIADGGPRVVVLDLVLSGDAGALGDSLRELGLTEDQVTQVDADALLTAAMERVPVIVPYRCLERHIPGDFQVGGRATPEEFLPKAAAVRATETDHVYNIVGVHPAGRSFLAAATETAHSCEFQDVDGKLRSDATVLGHNFPKQRHRLLFLSMPVAAARYALDVPWEDVRFDDAGLWLGDRLVPTDRNGMTMVGYSGPTASFGARTRHVSPDQQFHAARQRISAGVVVSDSFDPEELREKVVFVGLTVGSDRKRTPFSTQRAPRMPGIEKIAMHADAIVSGERLVYRPDIEERYGYLLTALLGFLAAVVGSWLSFRWIALLAPLGIALPLLGCFALFLGGVRIDGAMPAAAWGAAIGVAAIGRFVMEVRQRSLLETIVGRYLSPQIFERLQRDPRLLELRGEEREVTILFADLRDFTSWSEERPAAEVVEVLNQHMDALTQVVFKHNGTVDKFVGDCVIAYWGAPLPDPEHAQRACRAALEMLGVLDRQNIGRRQRGEAPLGMGIGINTGMVVVGNMGSSRLFNYTVIGDAVNVASRLEGLTKEAPFRVLVGPRTRELARKSIELESVGPVRVKGKRASLEAFGLAASRKPDESSDAASA